MSHILCIESSTKSCSVALGKNGECIASAEIISDQYAHAEKLHLFVRDVLREARLQMHELHAISVSKGPGSFTGLRIGIAAAKGFCFSLGIPLISIGTLEVMYQKAVQQNVSDGVYIPMIDARRMEVYMQKFRKPGGIDGLVQARVIDKSFFETINEDLFIFGDGAIKFRDMLQGQQHFLPDIHPMASEMIPLSQKKLDRNEAEDLAYFEPYYLKDFIAGKRRMES